jgi:CRISPR/Cas system-associated exonuclease Cas4 (RecB family)
MTSGRGERNAGRRAIRASEIGEYVFCHRAWWLRHMEGHESANTRQMELGTAAHEQHGRLVGLGAALRGLALLLVVLAVVAAVVSVMGR